MISVLNSSDFERAGRDDTGEINVVYAECTGKMDVTGTDSPHNDGKSNGDGYEMN